MLQFDESRKAWRAQIVELPAVVSNPRVFWEWRRGAEGDPMGKEEAPWARRQRRAGNGRG
jgi:hypothetical protein